MSASMIPPHDAAGPAGDPEPATPVPPRRRGAARIRPDADFELMLALRGAARARDLRNRAVRPRSAGSRGAAGAGDADGTPHTDMPRPVAHPS
jgi:hypothetical protein